MGTMYDAFVRGRQSARTHWLAAEGSGTTRSVAANQHNKLLSLVLAWCAACVLLMLCAPSAYSRTLLVDDGYTYTIGEDGGATITGNAKLRNYYAGSEDRYDLTIPSSVDGHPVVAIGEWAFLEKSIGSVAVPEGVRVVGQYAFSGGEGGGSLSSISLPSTLEEVAPGAFSDTRLSSVDLPEGLVSIGKGAFSNCKSLKRVVIPASVREIGEAAFAGCSIANLDVSAGNSAYGVQDGALLSGDGKVLLYYPADATGRYVVPDGVERVGTNAFMGSHLSEVVLPDTLRKIGTGAFLESRITRIELPGAVSAIGESAFASCRQLATASIGEGVSSIPESTFLDCASLKHVALPASLREIGENAFDFCFVLDAICYRGTQVQWEAVAKNVDSKTKVYPDGADSQVVKDALARAAVHFCCSEPVGHKTNSSSVLKLAAGKKFKSGKATYKVLASARAEVALCTWSAHNAKSVKVPSVVKHGGVTYRVTSVASKAFKGMKKLSKVNLGAHVAYIGKAAFSGCKKLASIKLSAPAHLASEGGRYADFKVCKGAFRGIAGKAQFTVPKASLKAYRKALVAAGIPSKAKVKAA